MVDFSEAELEGCLKPLSQHAVGVRAAVVQHALSLSDSNGPAIRKYKCYKWA